MIFAPIGADRCAGPFTGVLFKAGYRPDASVDVAPALIIMLVVWFFSAYSWYKTQGRYVPGVLRGLLIGFVISSTLGYWYFSLKRVSNIIGLVVWTESTVLLLGVLLEGWHQGQTRHRDGARRPIESTMS